jgi:hypothetical protein
MAKLIARARPVLLVVLAVAVIVAFATWRAGQARAEGGAPRFTPTEISDGVLFNEGPAADRLIALNRGPTQWTGDLREIQRSLNESIMADPAWAQGFAEQMQSGDPRAVDAAFTSLGERLRRVLDRRYGQDTVDKTLVDIDKQWIDERLIRSAVLHNEFSFDNGHEVWYALDVVVAAEIALAALVAAVIAAVYVVPVRPDLTYDARAKLAHEVLIEDITGGLRLGF